MIHESKTCTKEYTSLQKELQVIIARSNGWRVLMKGRRFGLAGALHYLACAYTTSNAVKQLTKLRCGEDSEEYSRKLVERVVACQQERQAREIQQRNQVGKETATQQQNQVGQEAATQQHNQVGKEAAQWESAQQQQIEELIGSGQIDSQACGLTEGAKVQSEVDSEVKAM